MLGRCAEKMIKRLTALFTILVAMIGLSSCAVQDSGEQFEGRLISTLKIIYKGDRPLDEDGIQSIIGSKAGSRYSRGSIDADIRNLYESGYIDDISFFAEADGLKVKITAEISMRPAMGLRTPAKLPR